VNRSEYGTLLFRGQHVCRMCSEADVLQDWSRRRVGQLRATELLLSVSQVGDG